MASNASLPPGIDPVAAARWQGMAPLHSPWLHEEVARRMEERLQVIRMQPARWLHWAPLKGGQQAHGLLQQRYAQAEAWAFEPGLPPGRQAMLGGRLGPPAGEGQGWLQKAIGKLRSPKARTGLPEAGSMDMLWANMALHASADPLSLLLQWRDLLAVNGFLMFSALGPDTLRELREVYATQGWPAPCQPFTDMHDWGDMLVQAGFAEPVMDMERITLTFASPQRALQELRELGRNLSVQRSHATRGRQWLDQLHQGLHQIERDGQLALTFEIVYGHALKVETGHKVRAETAISLRDMQHMLRSKG